MERRVSELVEGLPTRWLENYVSAFEEGRVQRHPHARFVTDAGESCLVGALAGARSAADMVSSPIWSRFLGSELEELSRRFEARRLTSQDFYEEAVFALAANAAQRTDLVPA
jgi:hypothetical protein